MQASKTASKLESKMGKHDEIGQLKPVRCTCPDCNKHFDTEKEMRYHKRDEPDHHYCKKCNLDFSDWEELTQHKVDAMSPFLEDGKKHYKDESPKHIVCEFCGMDFQSMGGRKLHRQQNHQADQSVECPGCRALFVRAGKLLAHYENGQCPQVTRLQFLGHVQAKHINAEVMKSGGAVRHNLQMIQEDNASCGAIEGAPEAQEDEEGGVNLLDDGDELQKRGIQPLQAEVDLIERYERPRLTQSNLESCSRASNHGSTQLTNSLRKMSIASGGTEETVSAGLPINRSMPASEYASQTTSRRGGNNIRMESLTSVQSPNKAAANYQDDDSASAASTTVAGSTATSGVWTAGKASQVLFKGAKLTPPSTNWEVIRKRQEEDALTQSGTKLLTTRFWDPSSQDFSIERFHRIRDGTYHCPFEGCEDVVYDLDVDLIGHFRYAHLKRSYSCPLCLKIFKTGSALITHSESAGKCKVKKSTKYGALLEQVSGGFLRAEELHEPKITRGKEALAEGIMDVKFEAKLPHET